MKFSKWTVVIFTLVLVVSGSAIFFLSCSSFGGKISGKRLERVEASPNHKNGKFINFVPAADIESGAFYRYLKEQIFGDQVRHPPSPIPVIALSPGSFANPPVAGLRAVWFGHSSVLIEIDGMRLMLDLVFAERVSPFDSFGPLRFHAPPVALGDLPHIDAVLISHDHYDHLDMNTTKHLASKGTVFFVGLGVGAHLEKWGVPENQIEELDWWESRKIGSIEIVSTPTRHYSGRGLFDRETTLWSSWSMIGSKNKVFYSGDTGYSDHFKKIGDKFGPFDLSVIKIGAYGPGASWTDIHMEPEFSVQAHIDLKAQRMFPVHWGTFNLAFHDWDEPVRRAVKKATEKNVDIVTPRIGDIVIMGEPFLSSSWWENVK